MSLRNYRAQVGAIRSLSKGVTVRRPSYIQQRTPVAEFQRLPTSLGFNLNNIKSFPAYLVFILDSNKQVVDAYMASEETKNCLVNQGNVRVMNGAVYPGTSEIPNFVTLLFGIVNNPNIYNYVSQFPNFNKQKVFLDNELSRVRWGDPLSFFINIPPMPEPCGGVYWERTGLTVTSSPPTPTQQRMPVVDFQRQTAVAPSGEPNEYSTPQSTNFDYRPVAASWRPKWG